MRINMFIGGLELKCELVQGCKGKMKIVANMGIVSSTDSASKRTTASDQPGHYSSSSYEPLYPA